MVSNPLFIIPDFLLHFPNELSYEYWISTLGLKEMGKFLWAGRSIVLPKGIFPSPSNLR